jgi:VCBS repeat-containing protein
MAIKIITAEELRSGTIELPASGGGPDFSAAALADARIVLLQGGQSVDLRGLIEPGATLGWQGSNLVVVSPSGEMVVIQDFLSLVGNAAIMTLQVSSIEPGAAVQTLVVGQHDNKLVWQLTFLSMLAWQEATLKSASFLRTTAAPVAYKTPDEVVMHETAFKTTRAIDMLRLLETVVAPLGTAPKTSPEQLAAPLADGVVAGDSGLLTDAPPTAEILIAPDVPMALYVGSEVSTAVAANGVPVTGTDTLRLKEGDGASTVQVLDNDYDPEFSTESGTESLTLLSAVASHGRVTFTADGVVSYQPDPDFSGTDEVIYQVLDRDGMVSEGRVQVTVEGVNDLPTLQMPVAQTAVEDQVLALSGLSVTDPDSVLTVTLQVAHGRLDVQGFSGQSITANGTTQVVLHGTADQINAVLQAANGLTYTPATDFNGTDALNMVVADEFGQTTHSTNITVNAVNDAPVRTSGPLPAAVVVPEDSGNTTAVSLGLTDVTYGPGGGADEAGQTLSYKIKTIPAFMTLFKADGTTPLLACEALTLAELQGLTYKTVGDANGTVQVEWIVQDSSGDASTDTITESFAVTVNAVNDAPVRTSGVLPVVPLILKDSANSTVVSLGLSSLVYGPGGGADEVTQTLTYTITAIPSFLLLFKADGTAVQKDDVLSAAELAGLTYKTKLGESGSGTIEWLVKDDGGGTTDSLPQSLAVKVASDLVVTQENLEITHTNSAGDIVSDFEWRSGDTLTVKWFDKASGTYLGDKNEPAFDVTRVAVDLSAWGLGVVQATETAPGSGLWSYSWMISADVTDPQTMLSQVKVQAFGTLPNDTVELHSAEVLVNRMVLGTEDSMVVGTLDGDVFVMPETSTSGAVVLGGEGNDVLDYRAVKTALTLDVQSDWVTHAALGLTDTFISIEEIWFSSKDQTIGVRDSSAAKVTWSKSEGNTVAEIDRDLDGANDITVVYKGLLLTALEQQQAVVSI